MLQIEPARTQTDWGNQLLNSRSADQGFYRISGATGSGKSHLTKLFLLDALREVESNPHAKLIVYDPMREFYAWIASLGLTVPINYFMPSDVDSVTLNFARDYPSIQDSQTFAQAFYPKTNSTESPFWGDSVRTIFAQVFDAIKARVGEAADLRLVTLVLEDPNLTKTLVGNDPYQVQARILVGANQSAVDQTAENLRMTIHSRIAQVKVGAAHLDHHRRENRSFSIRDFIQDEKSGVLVVSKDSTFRLTQDPLNSTLFLRLVELLDSEQRHPQRKVFVVIDEFPTLAGDDPCPGIRDMFLRLRSRGVVILITYQAITTLKRIYGEHATEILGQCSNVIYLKQPDFASAEYASKDLGAERGYEAVANPSYGGKGTWSVSTPKVWYDRPFFDPTKLMNGLRLARDTHGVDGIAKSPERGDKPWGFSYPANYIANIPGITSQIEHYLRLPHTAQELKPLTESERAALFDRFTDFAPEGSKKSGGN